MSKNNKIYFWVIEVFLHILQWLQSFKDNIPKICFENTLNIFQADKFCNKTPLTPAHQLDYTSNNSYTAQFVSESVQSAVKTLSRKIKSVEKNPSIFFLGQVMKVKWLQYMKICNAWEEIVEIE